MKVFTMTAFVLSTLAFTPTLVKGQLCDPLGRSKIYPSCAQLQAGISIRTAIEGLRQGRDDYATDLSARVQAARQRFFASPNPTLGTRAWVEFDHVLTEKDFWLLAQVDPVMMQGALATL